VRQARIKRAAGLGRPLVLSGVKRGVRLRVTPLSLVDPAPGSEFVQPQAANRFVAVRVELRNVGTAVYADTTSNGARCVDGSGHVERALIVDVAAPNLGRPRLRPGQARTGTLGFELKQGTRVRALRLTLDSGFGPETGIWTV
jgi:hypothetical protein